MLLVVILALCALLIGKAQAPLRVGVALAIAFLAVEAWLSPSPRALSSPALLTLAAGVLCAPPLLSGLRRRGEERRAARPLIGRRAIRPSRAPRNGGTRVPFTNRSLLAGV